jgi:hypothetical protein
MNSGGSLLYCQSHAHLTKPQVLGRILDNGDLLILRFHSGTTLLHAEHYELSCGCGFMYAISGTVVVGTQVGAL